MEAARAWARGAAAATVDDGTLDELRRLGAGEQDLAPLEKRAAEGRDGIGVWPENWPVIVAFVAVATQWRVVWLGGLEGGTLMRTGLDYAGVRAALDMLGLKATPDLFGGLQVMEKAALEAWSEA